MNAQATFKTERGNRYLMALCHHFGRKLDTQQDEESGRIFFPFGQCELRSTAGELTVVVAAGCQSELDRLIEIVTSHLERFAFREDPKLTWAAMPEPMAPTLHKPETSNPTHG